MPNKISINVVGFVLIDAPHSALNMGQADPNEVDENKIPVKFVQRGKDKYPYVSAQAWRYWWRNTLESRFGWKMSGITYLKGKNVAYTQRESVYFP